MPHGILEPHLFLELQKLEHIAAHAAAEAVEKSLVAVDVERRRLFRMKRAETLVAGAGFPQRHVLLNDLDDVRVHSQVVDESLGKHTWKLGTGNLKLESEV